MGRKTQAWPVTGHKWRTFFTNGFQFCDVAYKHVKAMKIDSDNWTVDHLNCYIDHQVRLPWKFSKNIFKKVKMQVMSVFVILNS